MTAAQPSQADAARRAIAAMNRGEALARDPSRPAQAAARAAYGEAIELLESLDARRHPRLANSLGAALLNRGQIERGLASADDARSDFEFAIRILDTLLPSGEPWPRRNLCGALVNLANLLLDAGEPEQAQARAQRALEIAQPFERASLVDTHAALLARRSLCDAIGQRVHRADGSAEALAARAGDLADEALALIRSLPEPEAEALSELGARFFRFGSQLYARYQPQFLLEFLDEQLGSERGASDLLLAIAEDAIAVAFHALSDRIRELADDPQTLDRSLRLLAELSDARPADRLAAAANRIR